MTAYTVWRCNGGGLVTFTPGDDPPSESGGMPIFRPVAVARFEAETGGAEARFREVLAEILPSPVPPSAEECVLVLEARGLPLHPHDMLCGVASGDQLRVAGAAWRLGELRRHRRAVAAVLGWAPADWHVASVVRRVLADWPEGEGEE